LTRAGTSRGSACGSLCRGAETGSLQFRDAPLADLRIPGSLSGSQEFAFGVLDPLTGARSLHLPASAIHFDPVVLPVLVVAPARVCITPTGPDGSGKIDVDGGDSDVDIAVRQDHRTNAAPGRRVLDPAVLRQPAHGADALKAPGSFFLVFDLWKELDQHAPLLATRRTMTSGSW
jgi:hypothetical protein